MVTDMRSNNRPRSDSLVAQSTMGRFSMAGGVRRRTIMTWKHGGGAVVGILLIVILWWVASIGASPVIIPSPRAVLEAFRYLIESKLIFESIGTSSLRIAGGWLLGAIVGIPLGFFLGLVRPARLIINPYIEALRYIPPIALVTVFLMWFGPGEVSKVLLLFYTAVFIVTINAMVGVTSATRGTIWAARSLGASERQIVLHVILPQTVPYVYTGLRLALANAFITIVAVEMVAANSGIGYLIWSSRDFMLTDQVFASIIVAGLMGIGMDRLFHFLMIPVLSRFGGV